MAGAIAAFVAIGIYSFRPLPDERFFHRKTTIAPTVESEQTRNHNSSQSHAYDYNYIPGAAESKALK